MNESIAIFKGLSIVIFMENFYQFPFVIGRPLWNKVCLKKDHYRKMLWKNLNAVITFTQQMCQIDNPNFNALLQRVRAGFLSNANITNLNSKVVADFFIDKLLKNTVIVQKNKTMHMIN